MDTAKFLTSFILVFLLFTQSSYSQSHEWAISMGGSSTDNGHAVKTDSKGNVYSVGWHRGRADFDPSSSTYNVSTIGTQDIYISKYSPSGKFLWVKPIQGGGWRHCNSLVFDANDNFYITGWFSSRTDFDPSSSTAYLTPSSWDMFVAKYDSSGAYQWAFKVGGTAQDIGDALCIQDGHLYVTGGFSKTADFDPSSSTSNLVAKGGYDVFVAKYDLNGGYKWSKQMGSTLIDYGRDLKVDINGNSYVTGYFRGTANFNTGSGTTNLVSKGGSDIFLVKLDSIGGLVYAKGIGSTGDDASNGIEINSSGQSFITGKFSGTTDFDPGSSVKNLISAGGDDIFLASYSSTGNYNWAHKMGGSGTDEGAAISLGRSGHLNITGRFSSSADFDPSSSSRTLTSIGNTDIFVASYTQSGVMDWAHGFGGTAADLGHGIYANSKAELFVIGYFSNTVDFDHTSTTANRTSFGGTDAYVLKMSTCKPSISNENKYFCSGSSYTFPDGSTTSTPKTHTSKFTSIVGCDSSIVTVLNYGNTVDTVQTKFCEGDSVKLPSSTFVTKAGTYTSTLTNSKGCDSLIYTIVQIDSIPSTTVKRRVCPGDSVRLPDNKVAYEPGEYVSHLSSKNKCDSIVTISLTHYPTYFQTQNKYFCQGDSLRLPDGRFVNTMGTYTTPLKTVHGCDSVISSEVGQYAKFDKSTRLKFCGDSATLRDGKVVKKGGVYNIHFQSMHGCDSNYTDTVELTHLKKGFGITSTGLKANEDSADLYHWYDCVSMSLVDSGRMMNTSIPGMYYLVVIKNACSDTSQCEQFDGTGISTYQNQSSVNIFPNPFSHTIRIESAKAINNVRVFNVLGEIIFMSSINVQTISTSDWKKGSYVIQVETSQGMNSQLLIKQ